MLIILIYVHVCLLMFMYVDVFNLCHPSRMLSLDVFESKTGNPLASGVLVICTKNSCRIWGRYD